jgi:hypothetical protein
VVSVTDVSETVKTFTLGDMKFPETVTLPPAPGAKIMLEVADMTRWLDALAPIVPSWVTTPLPGAGEG